MNYKVLQLPPKSIAIAFALLLIPVEVAIADNSEIFRHQVSGSNSDQKSDDDKDDDYMGPPRGDCPILIVPCPTSEQGAIEMSIDHPFFEWNPVEGATGYAVSIHSSEDPSLIVWPENGEPLSIVDTKLVYPSNLPPGEYLFVVEAAGVDRPPDEGRFIVDGQ